MQHQFNTRSEAERAIAQRGKAGKLKPVHLPGRRWLLTTNREGTVSRSLLYWIVQVELEREGVYIHPREINRIANQVWAECQTKRK